VTQKCLSDFIYFFFPLKAELQVLKFEYFVRLIWVEEQLNSTTVFFPFIPDYLMGKATKRPSLSTL